MGALFAGFRIVVNGGRNRFAEYDRDGCAEPETAAFAQRFEAAENSHWHDRHLRFHRDETDAGLGGLQLGKNVLATIFEVCPRVSGLFGLK